MKKIYLEFWADSFHEGDWACQNLMKVHHLHHGRVDVSYEDGFLPVYKFFFQKEILIITVYGSYISWSPLPKVINDLIAWGKPDLIIYDPINKSILLAVEETAAIPTGNQALQRCERLYGSAQAKIPFWYLLPEYGRHKDGQLRRDSIWPSIMALKLTIQLRIPSVVLHYADSENPEGYDFGTGVKVLFNAIYKLLLNFTNNKDILDEIGPTLKEHYLDILRFIHSQYKNIIDYLPGVEYIDSIDKRDELATLISMLAISNSEEHIIKYNDEYSKFLTWPLFQEYKEEIERKLQGEELRREDPFCKRLEESITEEKAYNLSSNTSGNTYTKEKMLKWLSQQSNMFSSYENELNPSAVFTLDINEFPIKKESGLHYINTSKNITYFFDKFADVKNILIETFPRLTEKLELFDEDKPTLVYVSNSISPGRIFGDPFIGQISAFGSIFGKKNKHSRYIITYFPHQSFTQILDTKKKDVKNKGFIMLRKMTDLVVFAGGVGVYFEESEDDARGKVL